MTDWSISKRINALTVALTTGIVILVCVGLAATILLTRTIEAYRSGSAKVVLANAVAEGLFEAKANEYAYRTNEDPALVEGFRGIIAEILNDGQKFADAFGDDTALLELGNLIASDAKSYAEAFDEMLRQQEKRNEYVTQAAGLGPGIRSGVNAALTNFTFTNNQRAIRGLTTGLQEFLLARIGFEGFLFSNSESDLDKTASHLATSKERLENALAATENAGQQAAVQEIIDSVSAYETAVAGAAETILARNETRGQMDQTGAKLAADVEAIVDTVVKEQGDLGAIVARTTTASTSAMALIGLLAMAASIFLARVVSRSVAGSISQSAAQMQKIADGDLELEILGTKAEHELGDIARALSVFRDNALKTRALEAEARAKEIEDREREAEDARRLAAAEEDRQNRLEEARRRMIAELNQSVGSVVEAGAKGDFSQRIDASFEEPELQGLADAINQLVSNVEAGVAETARVMALMSDGNLASRMDGQFDGTFRELKDNVNETIEKLSTLVSQISAQCDGLGGAAGQMTDQSIELARRAEQQAASLEETSAAMEEISASARSSAEGASTAAEFAQNARTRVDTAGGVVASAVDAMSDIRNASNRIGEIVGVIDGIAFQTNLLALNASVEAARAGPAGKGFAVVATEVRALAQRSGEASKDIKELIDESAMQVRKGVELVEETGRTLEEIMDGVAQMATTMQDLTTTAREQATGVGEVTTAITQLDVITQKNAALADHTREAAGTMREQSEEMRRLIDVFKVDTSAEREVHNAGREAPDLSGLAAE
ncbi:MAG: methyl-accepting chemotaxis protein [Pseudomonadota bacterium]